MRKWPNRLGKFASATLLSMGAGIEKSGCIHYNDQQAPHGIPTTLANPAAAGGGGGVAGQHPFALWSLPKYVDARGSHFGATRQAGLDVLGHVRVERAVPRVESGQVRRRGSWP